MMEALHQFTIDWLTEQSQDGSLAPEISADINRILNGQSNGKPIPVPTPVIYLVPRVTTGEKDALTHAVKALPYDLVKVGTYMQIIPDVPENFFQNAEQAMQAVHDNLALQEEVLEQDHRLHLPFVDADGNKFVTNVFLRAGALCVGVSKFT